MSRNVFASGLALGLLFSFAGCINQAAKAINPPPEGGGTLTCAQIVETCDSTCSDPLCLHSCSNQGTAEGTQQHDAVLACGERNGCTNEACMRTSCTAEVETCQGPEQPPELPIVEPPPPQ